MGDLRGGAGKLAIWACLLSFHSHHHPNQNHRSTLDNGCVSAYRITLEDHRSKTRIPDTSTDAAPRSVLKAFLGLLCISLAVFLLYSSDYFNEIYAEVDQKLSDRGRNPVPVADLWTINDGTSQDNYLLWLMIILWITGLVLLVWIRPLKECSLSGIYFTEWTRRLK